MLAFSTVLSYTCRLQAQNISTFSFAKVGIQLHSSTYQHKTIAWATFFTDCFHLQLRAKKSFLNE